MEAELKGPGSVLGVQEVGTVKSRAWRMGVRRGGARRVGALYSGGPALELRGLEDRVGSPRRVKGGARMTKDMGQDREEVGRQRGCRPRGRA